MKKWYRNTKPTTLHSQLSKLKHELVVTSQELRNRTKLAKRNTINTQFKNNQKQLYRNWRGKRIKVENAPTPENVESFWSGIWNKKSNFNPNAKWLPTLEKEYCTNVTTKEYRITNEIFQKVLSNMKNDGAPGNDLIRCFRIKKLTSIHNYLVKEFSETIEKGLVLPEWLTICRTSLLPKSEQTSESKNYRPITCQNVTYKIFTGILNTFITGHCSSNNIITEEQAGGKPGSWA